MLGGRWNGYHFKEALDEDVYRLGSSVWVGDIFYLPVLPLVGAAAIHFYGPPVSPEVQQEVANNPRLNNPAGLAFTVFQALGYVIAEKYGLGWALFSCFGVPIILTLVIIATVRWIRSRR